MANIESLQFLDGNIDLFYLFAVKMFLQVVKMYMDTRPLPFSEDAKS